MFNKKRPYGTLHGTGIAAAMYMQDGNAYDVDFNYVWSNPDATPPRGEERKTLEQAERAYQDRAAAIARGEVVPQQPKRQTEDKKVPPPPPESGTPGLTTEQQLMQLNVPRLQDMQFAALKAMNDEQPEEKRVQDKQLRAQVIKGAGAKEKLVKWLVENGDFSDDT